MALPLFSAHVPVCALRLQPLSIPYIPASWIKGLSGSLSNMRPQSGGRQSGMTQVALKVRGCIWLNICTRC